MCLIKRALSFSLLLAFSLCLPMFSSASSPTQEEILQALQETTDELEKTLQMNSELRNFNEEILRHNKVMSNLLSEQENFTENLLKQRNEDTRLLIEIETFYEERERQRQLSRILQRTTDVATGAGIGVLLFLAFSAASVF